MLTNFKISGSLFGSSLNINHLNLYIMEVVGGISAVIILLLLVKIICFKNDNDDLRKKLAKKNVFVIEPLLKVNVDYYIDGDADPLPEAGCFVTYHKKNGQLKWIGVGRFYANYEPIRGHELHEKLHEEIVEQEVLNRNYLEFLIKHRNLIPHNWPLVIPFWGTVYREIISSKCFVKCLVRRDGIYMVENRYLDTDFDVSMPAIIK